MIPTIIAISLAFLWLLIETDWMRIRLLVGTPADYGKRWIDTFVPLVGLRTLQYGLSEREYIPSYHPQPINYRIIPSLNGRAKNNGTYDILVSPGIRDVLCGKKWLDKHWNDLVDYQPEVYLEIGGVKYNMTIKQPAIIKDVMRANHLTRKQKLAYA